MHIWTLVFAIAATLASLGLNAHADSSMKNGPSVPSASILVRYGDLDLDTEAGAKTMLQRIERAAAKACGGQPTFSSYTGTLDSTYQDCRQRAVERAVNHLAAPMVRRIYSEQRSRAS